MSVVFAMKILKMIVSKIAMMNGEVRQLLMSAVLMFVLVMAVQVLFHFDVKHMSLVVAQMEETVEMAEISGLNLIIMWHPF